MSLLRFLTKGTLAFRSCSSRLQGKATRTPLAIGLSSSYAFSQWFSSPASPLNVTSSESQSSTIFRAASPAAFRRPSSQLVFLSVFEERRHDWESWIGYFREAGYDCVDMSIAATSSDANIDVLTEELHQQLRLLSLQRPPLVFAFFNKGSNEAIKQIQSNDPKTSGLVIVVPSSDKEIMDKFSKLNKEKLRILLLDESQTKDGALRQAELWMTAQGLA